LSPREAGRLGGAPLGNRNAAGLRTEGYAAPRGYGPRLEAARAWGVGANQLSAWARRGTLQRLPVRGTEGRGACYWYALPPVGEVW